MAVWPVRDKSLLCRQYLFTIQDAEFTAWDLILDSVFIASGWRNMQVTIPSFYLPHFLKVWITRNLNNHTQVRVSEILTYIPLKSKVWCLPLQPACLYYVRHLSEVIAQWQEINQVCSTKWSVYCSSVKRASFPPCVSLESHLKRLWFAVGIFFLRVKNARYAAGCSPCAG